jgi:A/G-specific adenine glycosylase
MVTTSQLHDRALRWYAEHRRDLPWRSPDVDAWGVLVSEVMLQQTPVARVEPVWRNLLARWPAPADLAEASAADVVRAWDRLGYPRRALRLLACARVVVEQHGGRVPTAAAELLALPGVGAYTAAAVSAFAHGDRVAVLDTNVRRVLGRLLGAQALPPPVQTRAETSRAQAVLPADAATSVTWNVAVMELGALVCTARAPRCQDCPLAAACAWRAAGYPADAHAARRRTQAWHGTDRQARGALMAVLRAHEDAPVPPSLLAQAWPEQGQRDRALASLITDGLAEEVDGGHRLPQKPPDDGPPGGEGGPRR